MDTRVIE